MASGKEACLVRRIKGVLKSHGFWVAKVHGGPFVCGLPDLLAIRNGRALWLEVKTEFGKVSGLQERKMKELINAGCVVEVVRSVEDVLGAICRFGVAEGERRQANS